MVKKLNSFGGSWYKNDIFMEFVRVCFCGVGLVFLGLAGRNFLNEEMYL